MAAIPLPVPLVRALVAGGAAGCGAEVVTIAALLSVSSPWVGFSDRRRGLQEAKLKFATVEGDLLTLLNIWKAWCNSGKNRRWAHQHCLNHRNLMRAADIRNQLEFRARGLGVQLDSCGDDTSLILRAFAAGLLMNAVTFVGTVVSSDRDSGTHHYQLLRPASSGGQAVKLTVHVSSVLHSIPAPWLLFNSVTRGPKGWLHMKEVSTFEPQWLHEMAPKMFFEARKPDR